MAAAVSICSFTGIARLKPIRQAGFERRDVDNFETIALCAKLSQFVQRNVDSVANRHWLEGFGPWLANCVFSPELTVKSWTLFG
jgi:hypothetical protein